MRNFRVGDLVCALSNPKKSFKVKNFTMLPEGGQYINDLYYSYQLKYFEGEYPEIFNDMVMNTVKKNE